MLPNPETELRVARQIDAACEMALFGADLRARSVCADIFLQHAPLLAQKRSLCQSFVECLLLLNMTALLIRLVRAVDGADLAVTAVGGSHPGRLLFSFSNGVSVTAPGFGLQVGRATRAKRAVRWSEVILAAASRESVPEPPPATRSSLRMVVHAFNTR